MFDYFSNFNMILLEILSLNRADNLGDFAKSLSGISIVVSFILDLKSPIR